MDWVCSWTACSRWFAAAHRLLAVPDLELCRLPVVSGGAAISRWIGFLVRAHRGRTGSAHIYGQSPAAPDAPIRAPHGAELLRRVADATGLNPNGEPVRGGGGRSARSCRRCWMHLAQAYL